MQEVYNISWQNDKKTAVAMGYFDGVHIGHKFLIESMKKYADEHNVDRGVFTFTKDIKLGHKGKDILSLSQKVDIIDEMEIDLFYSPNFIEFSQLTPTEFVDTIIVKSMNAKAVFCGENFFFGKNRAGDIYVLQKLCKERDIEVFIVPTVMIDNIVVSSTEIRKALECGDIEKANKFLGRNYSINFEVVHGKKVGSKLGTPTINQIYPNDMCTPKQGVYITRTIIDGKIYCSATGFGNCPTFSGQTVSCETIIDNYSGNLYGKKVKVEFCKYLFDIEKFENTEKLIDMINNSLEQSRQYNQAIKGNLYKSNYNCV